MDHLNSSPRISHPQVAFSGEPSKVQLGRGSPIGGLTVVVGDGVLDGSASCVGSLNIMTDSVLLGVPSYFLSGL